MGIFGSKKEKKPTLMEDIKKSSAWIMLALNSSGYKVDGSIESLREVERFFCEQMDDNTHTPKPGGLLSEKMGQRLLSIGSFVGEALIKEHGGNWFTNAGNVKDDEIVTAVQLRNGTIAWPVQWVMQRYKEGPKYNIYDYVIEIGKKEMSVGYKFAGVPQ